MAEPTNVRVLVTYLDTQEDDIRTRWESLFESDPGILSTFYYSDGNMACDCNRAQVFGREGACGEQRYLIRSIRLEDGTLIYSEDEGLKARTPAAANDLFDELVATPGISQRKPAGPRMDNGNHEAPGGERQGLDTPAEQ
jgi:hypothetical protein